MATILNKNLVRESTVEIDHKTLVVGLNADQSVELKLKGTRGKGRFISLSDLWEYLDDSPAPKKDSKSQGQMISLYDLRSHSATSELSVADMAKFDQIIVEMIDNLK